jgi:hypothetical protein
MIFPQFKATFDEKNRFLRQIGHIDWLDRILIDFHLELDYSFVCFHAY